MLRFHRTFRGQPIDMDAMRARNSTKVASGNARMNARGDLLGPGGRVLKTSEAVMQEYYAENPNAVQQVDIRSTEGRIPQAPQGIDPNFYRERPAIYPDVEFRTPQQIMQEAAALRQQEEQEHESRGGARKKPLKPNTEAPSEEQE